MAFSNIDSKGQKAVKCSHEASSIRKLAVQDTNGAFVFSGLAIMSTEAVQAHKFYKDVAKNREVWTVRKGDIFAKVRLRDGRTSTPFWSTRSRVERVIRTIAVYAGSEPFRITFEEFIGEWIPRIKQEGGLLGINWSGASLSGFNLDVDFVLRAIQSYGDA